MYRTYQLDDCMGKYSRNSWRWLVIWKSV